MDRDKDLDKLKIDRSRARRGPARGGGWVRALVVVLVLAGLAWVFRAPLSRQLDRLTLLEVEVVQVTRTSAASVAAVAGTAANGYVVADIRSALSADTPGRVVELNVVEGAFLSEGDVVARLYSREYEAALARAEAEVAASKASAERADADLEIARRDADRRVADEQAAQAGIASAEADLKLAVKDLERRRELVAEGVEGESALDVAVAAEERARAALEAARATQRASEAALREGEAQVARAVSAKKEAEAQVAVSEASVAQARAALEKTYVRAPFDCVVVLKDAQVGEVVSPNSQGSSSRGSVATVVDLASLEVQIDLPETLLAQIEVGAPARVFLDAYPNRPYAGRVLRIWPTANRQKATVEVRVGFDEPDGNLRPDLGARVVFGERGAPAPGSKGPEDPGAGEAGRILIPTDAVVRVDGRSGVFRVERDVVHWQPVEIGEPGEARGGRAAVDAGLEGGERIVADPPPALADGDRVRILNP